jgi:hypothetical protein
MYCNGRRSGTLVFILLCTEKPLSKFRLIQHQMVTNESAKTSCTNLGYYSVMLRYSVTDRNPMKNLSQDTQRPWWDQNWVCPKNRSEQFLLEQTCSVGSHAYILFHKESQAISHHKGYNHVTMVSRICIIQADLLILGAGVHSTQIGDLLVHGKASGHRIEMTRYTWLIKHFTRIMN